MERRLTGMIAAAAVLLVLFIMWDVFRPAPRPVAPAGPEVVSDPGVPPATSSSQGTAAPATPAAPTGREPTYSDLMARAETRRRIRLSASSTYLNEMLAASNDSMLRRWEDRGVQSPVHVWFAPTYAANFQPAFIDAIRRAFSSWNAVGVPVQFDLEGDSSNAEVTFRWRPQFEIERTGQTDLRWDQDGRIKSATVTLATFDPKGRAMDADDIRVVALHEIGHLLGLDHSNDSTDLMFPTARVRDLSDRDVRTVILLYQLSPGSVR